MGTFQPDVADMVSIDDWPSYSLCSPFASGFGSCAEAGKLRQDMAHVHRFLGAGKWFSHVFSTVLFQDISGLLVFILYFPIWAPDGTSMARGT